MPDRATGAGGTASATVTVPAQSAWVPVPTRSAALLILMATILELLGRLIDSTGVTVAAAAALGAVISDAALTPRIARTTVRRDLAARLTVGVPTNVALTVSAPPGRGGGRRSIVARYDSPALPTVQVVTGVLPPGHDAVAAQLATPERRGWWSEGSQITVEAFSPLGGFVRRRTMPLSDTLWVHPAPAPAFLLPDTDAGRATGSSQTPRSGSGTEFFGIREWRSGDTTSAIHWRASARRSQLVVMERERPIHTSLLVIAGTGPDSTDDVDASWERAIARTAATAVTALRSGRAVVTMCGPQWASPRDARDVLDWFAALPPTSGLDPSTLAAAFRTARPGCAVLWLATASGPPPAVVAAAKAAGAGTLTSAVALIQPATR